MEIKPLASFSFATAISKGADIHVRGKRGESALLCAVRGKSPSCVDELIKAGAKASDLDMFGRGALSSALDNASLTMAGKLLKAGAAVGLQAQALELLWAKAGKLGAQALEILAGHGLKLTLRNAQAAASQAAFYGDIAALEWVAAHGWPMIKLQRAMSSSPLEQAAKGGQKEACQWLVDQGLSLRRQLPQSRSDMQNAMELGKESAQGDISGWLLGLESSRADQAALREMKGAMATVQKGNKAHSKPKRV